MLEVGERVDFVWKGVGETVGDLPAVFMMFVGIDNENMKYINTFVKYLVLSIFCFLTTGKNTYIIINYIKR